MGSGMSHAYVHNRIKPNEGRFYLSRALFFAFVLLFGKMAVSLTFTIANELLKQQRRVTILVCAADKVTAFSPGSQHVFRSCFSDFCQTNSV